MEKKLTTDDFYGKSVLEELILDRFKYKGRGRPKNTDYIEVKKLMIRINGILNTMTYFPRGGE